MGHVSKPNLILLKTGDVREGRLRTLEKDLKEDPEYILEVLMELINFCKNAEHDGTDLNFYRFEQRLEEANFWAEEWLNEGESDN